MGTKKKKKYSDGTTPPSPNPGSSRRRKKNNEPTKRIERAGTDSTADGGGCSLELRQVRVHVFDELGLAHRALLDVEHLPGLDNHERWQAVDLVLLDCSGGRHGQESAADRGEKRDQRGAGEQDSSKKRQGKCVSVDEPATTAPIGA